MCRSSALPQLAFRLYVRSRLSQIVGLAPLPTIYLVAGLIFVGAAFLWVRTLRSETQRHKVHKVHHLMTLLVIIKALALLAAGFVAGALRWPHG